MNAWTDRTEGLNSRSAWTSWQRPHRELRCADAVSTPGSDMFATLSHRITHFLRCPRVILLEAFRQLAQQHARHSAVCSGHAKQRKKNPGGKLLDVIAFFYEFVHIGLMQAVDMIHNVYKNKGGQIHFICSDAW